MIDLQLKNGLFMLFVFYLLFASTAGSAKWNVQNPQPTESYLLSVESVNDNIVFIGGLGGTLLQSTDAGRNWKTQKFDELVNIRDICFKDSLHGWLIDSEHLYQTTNGGMQWSEVNLNLDLSLYNLHNIVQFNNILYLSVKPRTAVLEELINAESFLIKSTDNGQSFQAIGYRFPGQLLSTYFLDAMNGYLFTKETLSIDSSRSAIYKTVNGGGTWQKLIFPVTYFSRNMHFTSNDTGFVGRYRTTDSGKHWTDMFQLSLPASEPIEDIYFTDSLHGWAISRYKIFTTDDGGVTWSINTLQSNHRLMDIHFSEHGLGWIVGMAGNIFRKLPTTEVWESMSAGSKHNLHHVFFQNTMEGWCVGNFGTILHTNDGGATWEEQHSTVDNHLFKVTFINRFEGFVAGYGVVLHTLNGGKKWTVMENLSGWFIDIGFFDNSNGLLVDHVGHIYRTTNGGREWVKSTDEQLPPLESLSVVNNSTAWLGGWFGLAYTTDKGKTIVWYDVPHLSKVKQIQFTHENTGYLLTDYGDMLQSMDGGWNWKTIPRGSEIESGPITTFQMLDQMHGWIYWDFKGGYLRNIFANQILSTRVDNQYGVHPMNSMYFLDPNHGWAVGDGGTILKYTANESSSPYLRKGHVAIFPNPFHNLGTTIQFTLNQAQRVQVSVLNIRGQRIKVLYNGTLSNGDKSLRWEPDDIASGTYFVYVKCDEFRQAQKCVYINR